MVLCLGPDTLTLKLLITTAVDENFYLSILILRVRLNFPENCLLKDDSHVISSFIWFLKGGPKV